jgi:hypothetical protein
MSSGYIKAKDGIEIFYKDWGPKDAQRSCSITAGLCRLTIGTTRSFSF